MEASAKITLCEMVEEDLISLIREAAVVRRHCKRGRSPSPSAANSETLTPHSSKLTSRDIDLALSWRGMDHRLYSTTGLGANSNSGANNVTGTDNTIIDLNAYVRSEVYPPPPSEIGLNLHWLAIDGVQPSIPCNPPPQVEHDEQAEALPVVHRILDDEEEDVGGGGGGAGSGVKIRSLLKAMVSDELRLYFTKVTLTIESFSEPTNTALQDETRLTSMLHKLSTNAGYQELVGYFVKFTCDAIQNSVMRGNASYLRVLMRVCHALIINPHIHLDLYLDLVLPNLITCVVARHLSSGGGGGSGGSSRGGSSAGGSKDEDEYIHHSWILREEACRVLLVLCSKFGRRYDTIKPRILRTLCMALSPEKPLTTQYGGIVGLTHFGIKAIDAFVLDRVVTYWAHWQQELASGADIKGGRPDRARVKSVGGEDEVDMVEFDIQEKNRMHFFEIRQCQQALLDSVGIFIINSAPTIHQPSTTSNSNTNATQTTPLTLSGMKIMANYESLSETFGESLLPFTNVILSSRVEDLSYSDCFL